MDLYLLEFCTQGKYNMVDDHMSGPFLSEAFYFSAIK